MDGVLETKFLIVGAGPSGLALASFLSRYGLSGIVISSSSGTSDIPKAHIINPATMETLNSIGLDKQILPLAVTGAPISSIRWSSTLAGPEYVHIPAWGISSPTSHLYATASPFSHLDLPQTLLEPLLLAHATTHSWTVRFNTSLVSFSNDNNNDSDAILATVTDDLTSHQYTIRTKYLFGADGGHSTVVNQLGIPLMTKPNPPVVMTNVYFKADLAHLVKYREGFLHWLMQPGVEGPDFGVWGALRMVRMWDEWMITLVSRVGYNARERKVSEDEYAARIAELIGEKVEIEVVNVSFWAVRETVAERYAVGNVFALGDAVHRHPPAAGLGLNTGVQDAWNLAWKIGFVEKGWAGKELLETYSSERQPVGKGVVERANDAMRANGQIWDVLGVMSLEEGRAALQELESDSAEGRERRRRLREAVKNVRREFNGIGTEMSQLYEGAGVYTADEEEPFKVTGEAAKDPVLYYQPSTYPGRRLPHVWLNRVVPGKKQSTLDLAGHGGFTLFTGPGGQVWKEAAQAAGNAIGIDIKVVSVGYGQDWEDSDQRWAELSGVEESGAVLVRPDRFVAWRANQASTTEVAVAKLEEVIRSILGRKGK